METEEFWDLYINESLLENYDKVMAFFSQQPLPENFLREYDYTEVILEVLGVLETAKEHEKLLSFISLLQELHPAQYMEAHEFVDDFLVSYYCFHEQTEKLDGPVRNFMVEPDDKMDMLQMVFDKLLFYQQLPSLRKLSSLPMVLTLQESPQLIMGAEAEIATTHLYLELEQAYRSLQENKKVQWEQLQKDMEAYNIFFEDDFLPTLQKAFSGPEIEKAGLPEDRKKEDFIYLLQGHFLKYMAGKGVSFPLSARIWSLMLVLWEEYGRQQPSSSRFFYVSGEAFLKFLKKEPGSIMDNRPELAAVLWGSHYVYDFLTAAGLVDPKTRTTFIKLVNREKAAFIFENIAELWRFSYVHHWQKPDSMVQDEFNAEREIFRKSFYISGKDFKTHKEELQELLDQLEELKAYFQQAEHRVLELMRKREMLRRSLDSPPKKQPKPVETIAVRTTPKIGRNDPCSCGSGKKYKKCCGK